MKDWINQVQSDAAMLCEAFVTTSNITAAASGTQTLPSAVRRIKGMYVSAGGVQYQPMQPVSLEEILERRVGATSGTPGTPTLYALLGLSQFEVYPTPIGTETISIYYSRAPVVLSGDSDVPELPEPFASKLLEYGALAEAADFKRDDALQGYQQRYAEWVGKLHAHLTRRKGGLPEQMMVLGTLPYVPHDPSTDWGY